MNNCKYLKIKLNRCLECKKQNKLINVKDCANCPLKEYKMHYKALNTVQNPIKKYSKKRIKAEKERFSIIYQDLTKCAVCGSKQGHIDNNEVYEGAKRGVSMKYGFIIPLCYDCHKRFHNDREFALIYKRKFQKEYEKTHSRSEFINIIHRNYL